jgi:hypothetical protein
MRLLRSKEGQTSSTTGSRDDGNLLDLVIVGNKSTNNGMSHLMVLGNQLLLLCDLVATVLLKSGHDTVDRSINFLPANGVLVLACSRDGGFVRVTILTSKSTLGLRGLP